MPGRNLVESGRADAVGGVRASGRVVVPIYSGSKPDWLAEGSAVVEHGGQIGISALHLEWIVGPLHADSLAVRCESKEASRLPARRPAADDPARRRRRRRREPKLKDRIDRSPEPSDDCPVGPARCNLTTAFYSEGS